MPQIPQLQCLLIFQEIFLGVSWDNSNKKTKNEQTNKQINKQTNIFLINNISAKSGPIFMKHSGNLPRGILRWFKWTKNKQSNKWTFFRSTTSQLNQVQYWQNFQKSSWGYPKIIEIKHTHKQTNKQITKINQQYLS